MSFCRDDAWNDELTHRGVRVLMSGSDRVNTHRRLLTHVEVAGAECVRIYVPRSLERRCQSTGKSQHTERFSRRIRRDKVPSLTKPDHEISSPRILASHPLSIHIQPRQAEGQIETRNPSLVTGWSLCYNLAKARASLPGCLAVRPPLHATPDTRSRHDTTAGCGTAARHCHSEVAWHDCQLP